MRLISLHDGIQSILVGSKDGKEETITQTILFPYEQSLELLLAFRSL